MNTIWTYVGYITFNKQANSSFLYPSSTMGRSLSWPSLCIAGPEGKTNMSAKTSDDCMNSCRGTKGVAEWGSWTKGWRGGSGQRPKKNCDPTDFDGRSGHWRAQRIFGWFSWSSRCVWVAVVVTVLAVAESRRVFWTRWHPSNSSSEDGKETVKIYITH